jgi:hypothetical protein
MLLGSKFNGMHLLLISVDDFNLFGDNINARKKSTDALIGANKNVRLEVNSGNEVYVNISSPDCRTNS